MSTAGQQTVAHASGILLVAFQFFQQHPILKRRAGDKDDYRRPSLTFIACCARP